MSYRAAEENGYDRASGRGTAEFALRYTLCIGEQMRHCQDEEGRRSPRDSLANVMTLARAAQWTTGNAVAGHRARRILMVRILWTRRTRNMR